MRLRISPRHRFLAFGPRMGQARRGAVGFLCARGMAEQLREAARERDRSMSAVIRNALEAELQREQERSR